MDTKPGPKHPSPARKPAALISNIVRSSVIKAIVMLFTISGLLFVSFEATRDSLSPADAREQKQVEIWWPAPNATLAGVQPFKAMLEGRSVEDYQMFWQVDNGQWNRMDSNYQDYPHKESSVDLSSWNWSKDGRYLLSFIAIEPNGQEIAKKDVYIYGKNSAASNTANTPSQSLTPVPTLALSPAPVQNVSAGNPLAGQKFYVNPNSLAKQQANSWRDSRPADAALMDKVALGAESYWIGNWTSDVRGEVSRIASEVNNAGAVPVFIAYNIPQRDCGGYSAGGSGSPDGYRNWISQFAGGIGSRKAVVILEPDATALTDCLSESDRNLRNNLLQYAVETFKALGNTSVYIDAGHALWVPAPTMASRLQQAGVAQADGFALNVSNFIATDVNLNYGYQVAGQLGNKHFIIDTSRNGQGAAPNNEWCNPDGRGLGTLPTTNTGLNLVDAFVWGKKPGESDGNCNGGPGAGQWWPEFALGLASRANW